MKDAVKLLEENGLLKVIDEEVDIDLEIPHIAYIEVKKEDSKAILFNNPVCKRLDKKLSTPVLCNLFGSIKATNLFLTRDVNEIAKEIEELLKFSPPKGFMGKMGMASKLFNLKSIFPKRVSGKGKCQKIIVKDDEIDLFKLPILKTWEEDGGAFITMGQVYTTSLDGKINNLGMYRLQIYSKNRVGMHWQIHKDSSNFFEEYKKAGEKMPVSIAIGGDPLYTWCATAPLPYGIFELLMYGFIKKKPAKLVKSITNPIYIPYDVDFVIEGWVDTNEMKIEGPFGDHTGYYTLKEPYPVMTVSAITLKKDPIFLATVVGKPPLEDKYMGWATERIFLPLLKTTTPDLIDYVMPENGVFHNLIIARMRVKYPAHAKQFMHAFWGIGQMSFVKHAIFIDEEAPDLENYELLTAHILDRISPENIMISEGVCDALDHSSPKILVGGKLGIDCTGEVPENRTVRLLGDKDLLKGLEDIDEIKNLSQYYTYTKNPICVISVNKKSSMKTIFEKLTRYRQQLKIVIFVDEKSNDINNPYMLVWRVVNNIDAKRDIFFYKDLIGVDGTNKNYLDGFTREWPKDTNCNKKVIENLRKRNLIDVDDDFLKKFHIVSS